METQDANQQTPSWNYDGKEYPLYPFDVPPTITLPNGTVHYFRMWDDATEKKREDMMKTVIVTSPVQINGEFPRDVKTDYSRSLLGYYEAMIDRISGVSLNGHSPEDVLNAKDTTDIMIEPEKEGDAPKQARIVDLIGVPVRKAAAARIYSGKVEVERPDLPDDETDDAFEGDPFETTNVQDSIDREERKREVYKLTIERNIIIRQELGIEQQRNGRSSPPTHVIRYHFREPSGKEFSKWELHAYRGYSLSLQKGGEKSERFYNLDTVKSLFSALIDRIEGASIDGSSIDLDSDRENASRIALLAKVPLSIKKLTVATLFSEMSSLGNF